MAQRHDSALDRRIPRWSAMLLARLTQDRPTVITRDGLGDYLAEIGLERDVDATVRDLVRLGWLTASRRKGVWIYVPPGEENVADPYIDLRAWVARDTDAVFALAGEAAAWHLGYLDRRHTGPIAIWVPDGVRPPFGVRQHVSVVRLGWDSSHLSEIGPTRQLLRKRGLDLTRWAGGLKAFGPEALLAQLATRPASFIPWADLVVHMADLVGDLDTERLLKLLSGQSSSAWQRAAYLVHLGDDAATAELILGRRPNQRLSHVTLGDGPDAEFSSKFRVTDWLAAPNLRRVGKA